MQDPALGSEFSQHPDQFSGRFDTNPYEPELGSLPDGNRDEEAVNKTGTTTIGIATEDGVIVATDKRASLGGRFVSNKEAEKIEQIHPTGATALSGSVGGIQAFAKQLRVDRKSVV